MQAQELIAGDDSPAWEILEAQRKAAAHQEAIWLNMELDAADVLSLVEAGPRIGGDPSLWPRIGQAFLDIVDRQGQAQESLPKAS